MTDDIDPADDLPTDPVPVDEAFGAVGPADPEPDEQEEPEDG